METGKLFVVATPIGNLEDITFRGVRVLKETDLIACEDTRVTKKLTSHYSIGTQLISFHQHSKLQKFDYLVGEMRAGKNVALVTDAGTPGVSDPGNMLVEKAVNNGIQVVAIPGASALASIVSIAGIDLQMFTFLGFPPHKKGREKFFKQIIASELPVIYYESPHRVIKNLQMLQDLGSAKKIIIGRELTKMFEEVVRGTVEEVLKYFLQHKDKVKGEFAVVAFSHF